MLDIPLIDWQIGHPFTVRDACEGVLIMDGLGSGKTSGSGALLAKKYLTNGFSGLARIIHRENKIKNRYP